MLHLARLRPSNLIILCALPFIVWLFATSPNYSRSLAAIVGVERGSGALVPGFLLLLVAALAALWAAIRPFTRTGRVAAGLALATIALAAASGVALPFANSVVANAVDPFVSTLAVAGETPRRLTEAAAARVGGLFAAGLWTWLALNAAGQALLNLVPHRAGRWRAALIVLNAPVAAYILLAAHLGFAAGLATSIRAAVLAYGLAVLLGLVWVGLMQLRLSRRTPWIAAALVLALAVAAAVQFLQPRAAYVLLGDASAKVGVVKGTPQALIDAVRFGAFPGAPGGDVALRTFASATDALAGIDPGGSVSGALVPAAAAPAGAPVLWRGEALPDGRMAAGAAFAVTAVLGALLLVAGLAHRRHPLSVGAEFIVDTIRGIPMLVIVLYIGLPLAGAVKEASGGFLDPPNLMRGILAMALAYSAYLAEIFRSGINAVPVGQVEAARSLGLTRWQTARHVILPQAFRIIIPPLGNEFIAILKDTSLLSILSIRDITQRMREFQSASFLPFAPYNSAAILYVLLTLLAASLIAMIERRTHVARR